MYAVWWLASCLGSAWWWYCVHIHKRVVMLMFGRGQNEVESFPEFVLLLEINKMWIFYIHRRTEHWHKNTDQIQCRHSQTDQYYPDRVLYCNNYKFVWIHYLLYQHTHAPTSFKTFESNTTVQEIERCLANAPCEKTSKCLVTFLGVA